MRAAKLTPEESRIVGLLNRIVQKRESVKKDQGVPDFIEGEYAEAERYAANAYCDRAERDAKETRELGEKIAKLLGSEER